MNTADPNCNMSQSGDAALVAQKMNANDAASLPVFFVEKNTPTISPTNGATHLCIIFPFADILTLSTFAKILYMKNH